MDQKILISLTVHRQMEQPRSEHLTLIRCFDPGGYECQASLPSDAPPLSAMSHPSRTVLAWKRIKKYGITCANGVQPQLLELEQHSTYRGLLDGGPTHELNERLLSRITEHQGQIRTHLVRPSRDGARGRQPSLPAGGASASAMHRAVRVRDPSTPGRLVPRRLGASDRSGSPRGAGLPRLHGHCLRRGVHLVSMLETTGWAGRAATSGGMRVRILRGAHEIGGSCVELEYRGSRIVLDVGKPLGAGWDELVPLPGVPGLADGSDPGLCGVVISHPHLDHYGLIGQVSPQVPVFIGEEASKLLAASAFFSSAGMEIHPSGFLATGCRCRSVRSPSRPT